jgi:phosphoribosyl-AMP cyclohydrolase
VKRDYFIERERLPQGSTLDLYEMVDQLAFNEQGLIPVITQDAASRDVLMMAWMNKAAIEKTLETGKMVYWSRSRQQFWLKGETSGHTQVLQSMRFDCDGDCLLCLVEQTGAACHTGRKNCFYFEVDTHQRAVSITRSAP